MKKLLFALPALILAGCGSITLQTVVLDNFSILVPQQSASPSRIAFLRENQFASIKQKLPGALSLSVSAAVTYDSSQLPLAGQGNLRQAKVYVRPEVESLLTNSKCNESPDRNFIICEGLDLSVYAAGTVTLGADRKGRMDLSGPALNAAARSGEGYFGIAITEGGTVAGERLNFTNVTARVQF